MKGFKVFTHDLRPPVQGGEAVWDGSLPFQLPEVEVDRSSADCGAGWSLTTRPEAALRIAGLWPTGRPSRLFLVETPPRAIVEERGEKTRASRLVIVREAEAAEVVAAVHALSVPFAPHVEWMAQEQLAWRSALARPAHDVAKVEAALTEALASRGLAWKLRRFGTAWAVMATWDARDAWATWDARDAWDARAAWDAWDARAARAAWDAKAARAAWDAWAAWDARAAWAAWAALTLGFASRQGWVKDDAMLLTRGLRDAYACGLELAIPTGTNELGWSVAP